MFKLIAKRFSTATLFEKLLLIIGISVGIVGFWLINQTYYQNPTVSWNFIMVVFLWLILIFLIILTDSNESIKEELGVIIKQHIKETQLLREEIKVLNKKSKKK